MIDPRPDVLAFGETMVRLSTDRGEALADASALRVSVAGSETNVLAALASAGRATTWIGAVAAGGLGERVVTDLRGRGIDVRYVQRVAGHRQATFFVESFGTARPTRVTYDRTASAIHGMRGEGIPWDLVNEARWVHLTGITPALGGTPRRLAARMLQRAVATETPVSFDVNFRSKLWLPDEARAVLAQYVEMATLLVCGIDDAREVFGIDADDPEGVAREFGRRRNGRTVVVTAGGGGAGVLHEGTWHWRDAVPATPVDRLGAGDAFTAGVIDGWLEGDVIGGLGTGVRWAAEALETRGDAVRVERPSGAGSQDRALRRGVQR